jgi:hypothetical protein
MYHLLLRFAFFGAGIGPCNHWKMFEPLTIGGRGARNGAAVIEAPAMRSFVSALVVILVSCGGSQKPADSAESATASEHAGPAEEDDAQPSDGAQSASDKSKSKGDKGKDEKGDAGGSAAAGAVPTQCAKAGAATCVPDRRFVEHMCSDSYPTIALYLFGNGNPFSKGYLTRRTQAWNAEGGASDNSWLEFDEEVLVLAERGADKGGMQVSGAGGSYMALRWNGSCVTLAKEELTLSKPPAPKAAKVEWRYLDDNVQEALRTDATINDAVIARRKECKGAVSGDVSLKCVKADDKLSAVIVDYLRKGGKIPVPSKLPK